MRRAEGSSPTEKPAYAERLARLEGAWWKRALDVQAPYRAKLRSLEPGRTLEVGCGIGRNLVHLAGAGVGIDHNPESVRIARERGLAAYTPEEFLALPARSRRGFDSLLLSHVVEHMTFGEASALLGSHVGSLKESGQVILVAPQEAGFRSDPTHVTFFDFALLERLLGEAGFRVASRSSFPFPRLAGRIFRYNEFVVTGRPGRP